jgi:16S rRNA (cytosine967-C5)-methyltransferase
VSEEKPREIAARLLAGQPAGAFIESRLEAALAQTRLSPVDRHFCQELVYGVMRWRATLDFLIARKCDDRSQKPLLKAIVALGLYQIFWLDRVPDHAAVSESVDLAKHMGLQFQAGFVNALLRGYLREADATRALLEEIKIKQPYLGYSHPEWLWQRWSARYGAAAAATLMDWNNHPPGTFARINTLKTTAEKLLPQWREEGVVYDFVSRPWLPENLIFELKEHLPLPRLRSFKEGAFYVQDPSTLLAVLELAPKPGDSVLDLCSAPGGKLTLMAQLMENQGKLAAYDTSADRLKLVSENCTRLGVTVATIAPPAQPPHLPGGYDRVLVDAPCSNTGVVRRRVDLRWRIRPEEITRLRRDQLAILHTASDLLKVGGTMVYSTCSLEPEENGELIQEFLTGHKHFERVRERELTPFADQVDGAYAAVLVRKSTL